MPAVNEYKCRNCGASLSLSAAVNGVLTCEYCHSSFTVPKKETSTAALDFIRTGEHELDTCSFDRAYAAYQKAAESDPSEPEAYFGMALSEFKVRYIRDVKNNCLQAICYDVSDKSFRRDANYRKALQLATPEQRAEYERKAKDIDYIRDEFYNIRETGANYDCFICVKVSDDNGGNTQDCLEAMRIYNYLKSKGYSPFFSEEEIRSRVGVDYEALILYALHTAECMLIVCGDEKYLKTPWVRNEYMRFLSLIGDERKESDAITVAFRGTPIEKLEGKRGKIQGIDLSRPDGYSRIESFVESHTPEARARREQAENKRKAEEEEIKRRLAEQASEQAKQLEEFKRKQEEAQRELENKLRSLQTPAAATVPTGAGATTQSLLKRAAMFLESGDFNNATDYYNRVLDIDPECGDAWLGLMLSKANRISKASFLTNLHGTQEIGAAKNNRDYINAKRYAAGAFKDEIADFSNKLDELYDKAAAAEQAERERKEKERLEAQARREKAEAEERERQRIAAEEKAERERIKREKERKAEEARRRAEAEERRRREEEKQRYLAEQARVAAIRQRNFNVFLPFFILSLLFGVLSAVFALVESLPSLLRIITPCVAAVCFVIMTVFGIKADAKFWLFLTFIISAGVIGVLCGICEFVTKTFSLRLRFVFPFPYIAFLVAAIAFSVVLRKKIFIIAGSIICGLALFATITLFATYTDVQNVAAPTMFLVCAALPPIMAFYAVLFKFVFRFKSVFKQIK